MALSRRGTIQFIKKTDLYDKERPFQIFLDGSSATDNGENNNLEWEMHEVSIQDFRNSSDYFDIDNHGFTSRKLPGFNTLHDGEHIEKEYLRAVESLLLKEISQAKTAFIFDWRIRDSQTHYPSGLVDFGNKHNSLLPSNFAHIDMAPISIVHRIQKTFPEQADNILAQRIRAINVWKPLDHPVDEWPLALCGGETIAPSTLLETDQVRRDNITTVYYTAYAKEQKWHFLERQTPEEVLIFKHFDSDPEVRSSFAMHSSVKLSDLRPNARPRRSIEVRVLVFEQEFALPKGEEASINTA